MIVRGNGKYYIGRAKMGVHGNTNDAELSVLYLNNRCRSYLTENMNSSFLRGFHPPSTLCTWFSSPTPSDLLPLK